MAKRRRAKPGAVVTNPAEEWGQTLGGRQDVLTLWADGLDLLDFALGLLADANLRPGADDSLIARGNLLASGVGHSRLARDGLAAGLVEPAHRLIREQFNIWRGIALARLSPECAVDSGGPRRLRKRLDSAICRSGRDLDAELASLAREGSRTLRDARSLAKRRQGIEPVDSSAEFMVEARWGSIALGLLLHEAGQLGLMTEGWRARTAAWDERFEQWLGSQPSGC